MQTSTLLLFLLRSLKKYLAFKKLRGDFKQGVFEATVITAERQSSQPAPDPGDGSAPSAPL